MNRLLLAMIAYVMLGVLTWTTITDPKFRAGTMVVLALFAFKTWVKRDQVMHPDTESEVEKPEAEQVSGPM